MKKYSILFGLILAVLPAVCFASIGVGVGAGQITYDEPVHAGNIYILPAMTIVNTGTETAVYSARLAFQQDQVALRPQPEWFQFDPLESKIEPGSAQVVQVRLTLPLKVIPGDYFAYVEAFPFQTAGGGKTSIGIAAATKLYFTVEPANIWQGLYYRSISYYKMYYPWPLVALGMIFAAILVLLFRKYFKFSIAVKKEPEKVAAPEQQTPLQRSGESKEPIDPQEPKV